MHFSNKESGNIKLVDLRNSKRNKSQTSKNVRTGNIVMDIVFTSPNYLNVFIYCFIGIIVLIPQVQRSSPTFVGKALLLDYLSLECFHSEHGLKGRLNYRARPLCPFLNTFQARTIFAMISFRRKTVNDRIRSVLNKTVYMHYTMRLIHTMKRYTICMNNLHVLHENGRI